MEMYPTTNRVLPSLLMTAVYPDPLSNAHCSSPVAVLRAYILPVLPDVPTNKVAPSGWSTGVELTSPPASNVHCCAPVARLSANTLRLYPPATNTMPPLALKAALYAEKLLSSVNVHRGVDTVSGGSAALAAPASTRKSTATAIEADRKKLHILEFLRGVLNIVHTRVLRCTRPARHPPGPALSVIEDP